MNGKKKRQKSIIILHTTTSYHFSFLTPRRNKKLQVMAGLLARALPSIALPISTPYSKRYGGLLSRTHVQLRGQLQFLTGFPFKQINCHHYSYTTFSIKLYYQSLYIEFYHRVYPFSTINNERKMIHYLEGNLLKYSS